MDYKNIINNDNDNEILQKKMKFINNNYLNDIQKQKILLHRNTLSREELLEKLYEQQDRTLTFLQSMVQGNLTGWEMTNEQSHPMIFELGHIALFYMHHFLRHYTPLEIPKEFYEMFDSLINKPEDRIHSSLLSFQEQYKIYRDIISIIIQYIKENMNSITPSESYMLNVCLLHNEMHNEVLLFLLDMLGKKSPVKLRLTMPNQISYQKEYQLSLTEPHSDILTTCKNIININTYKNPFIKIEEGIFQQGLDINDKLNVWDNEMPKHSKKIKTFYCQKYPVTNKEYIQFIEDDGYKKTRYWSSLGKKWLQKTKRTLPRFWIKNNGIYYRKHFDNIIPITNNELLKPVVKINFFEAEAYANYIGGRLPTESEYEYMTTNRGTTNYPWGNDDNKEKYCNINYTNGDVLEVSTYKNKNIDGIVDLMGNCWYWTSTHFYPYDGFIIDGLYDTFSYPFFYFRMVIKGAAWTCGKELAYPQYRNSQEPEKSFHYTGIRVVKDKIEL